MTFAPPLVQTVAELAESGTEYPAGGLDADGMRVLAAPYTQPGRGEKGVHRADADAPVEDDGALEMGRVAFGVDQESLCLSEMVACALDVWLDRLGLGPRHAICNASADPTSGVTGPRRMLRTRLLPLWASAANSSGR